MERFARVDAFPLFGGRPSDDRIRRTGRIDVSVTEEPSSETPPIGMNWEVTPG
jgi:hypothetical protein